MDRGPWTTRWTWSMDHPMDPVHGIKKLYNHSNKPMRVPDLKSTWISRNFRIQNIHGTLIQMAEMTKMK